MNSFILLCLFAVAVNADALSWDSPLESDWENDLYTRGLADFLNKIPGIGGRRKNGLVQDDTDSDKPDPNNQGTSNPGSDRSQNDFPGGIDLGSLLNKVKAMAEKLVQKTDFSSYDLQESSDPDQAKSLERVALSDLIDFEMRPTEIFKVPDYYNAVDVPAKIYDEINYEAARRGIVDEIDLGIAQGIPPRNIMYSIIPILYGLKSGCTVNALQRLISDGLNRWADDGMRHIATGVKEHTNQTIYGLNKLLETMETEIMSEVNRVIFGLEFRDFESVTRFIQTALNSRVRGNSPVDPASLVLHLSQCLIQCTPTATYLEGFVSRLAHLRQRIIRVNPVLFSLRILKANNTRCNLAGFSPRDLRQSIVLISGILKPIQDSLKEMVYFVESSLFFENDTPIVDIFPQLLGENRTRFLAKVLDRLRHPKPLVEPVPEPFDGVPEPYQNSSDFIPEATTSNDTLGYSSSSTPPPTVLTTPIPTGQDINTSPSAPPPARRSEEDVYEEAKLLDLLLKRLVAAKRNSPR